MLTKGAANACGLALAVSPLAAKTQLARLFSSASQQQASAPLGPLAGARLVAAWQLGSSAARQLGSLATWQRCLDARLK